MARFLPTLARSARSATFVRPRHDTSRRWLACSIVAAFDLRDRLAVLPQHVWPQRRLTVLAGRAAAARARWWVRRVIPWFIARYGVDMAETADPGPAGYACFNDFFTRALRDGVRPLAGADFVSPVDGAVIQCGAIEGDQLLQAKGHRYSTQALANRSGVRS